MDIEQAKLFNSELNRVEASARNGRSITILVSAGLVAYMAFVGFFIDFETVFIIFALLGCVVNWLLNARKAAKYKESLNSYCWSKFGKSYDDAKYNELSE
ncbi:TPA: hypothetical protein SMF39_003729 [Serratia marcescens]|uniref:hypothetical protein n=1 Tax=Serratia TaxID=613 RepID=UPI0011AB4809|nr:hypothetical protein [Serratia marcescens]DAP97694.1 MAG TPA: hypothetical protein [Caudoviricetes sp.]MDU7468732.1 hypothetical protein [Serratia marcescens]WAZ01757.1 hypothetical protein O3T14_02995 [Serratia marcescens]HEJ6958788.1 hypothetical protein [Serratia marcescens]HEJ8121840.1 hypothetical protein [Serratia marcescens]